MRTALLQRTTLPASLLSAVLLGGCVSQGTYDNLQSQNQSLKQQLSEQSAEITASKAQVARLQETIRYTVNSDLLFPPGGWEISSQGKEIIARMAQKLAPTQQNRLLVNGYTDNAPIGSGLQRQGITSNEMLSERRAQSVRDFLISQGVKPELMAAKGYGETSPIASNSNPKDRAQNRRVELTLAGSGA